MSRERIDWSRDRSAAAIEHLGAERPEPLLALYRGQLLERSAHHAEDTLDVAAHLAFRESPDVVTRNDW